jgi:hypothetical protein
MKGRCKIFHVLFFHFFDLKFSNQNSISLHYFHFSIQKVHILTLLTPYFAILNELDATIPGDRYRL